MNALEWLRARLTGNGDFRHDWSPIRIEGGGHVLELEVSADAARLCGVRMNIGARSQQLLADALDAMLPTAIIIGERHRQATVKLRPHTMNIETATAADHSKAIDDDLANDPPAVQGVWLVSDVGKSWTIHRLSSPTVAIAEGLFLDGMFPHDIFGLSAVRGVLAVRVPGSPEVLAGKHNLVQGDGPGYRPTDYSQKALFVRRVCALDGVWTDLGTVYSDPDLCRLVSPDGRPLPARHPGVEELHDSPEWKQLAEAA